MTDDPLYEAVTAYPQGEATVARLALTASEYGYDGIVVRNHGDERPAYDADAIESTYDVDVVKGVEIRTDDPSSASGHLGNHRPEATIVAVHGGTDAMNRFAVAQPAVDVLAHPTAGDASIGQVLARTAAENGVRLEVSLAPLVGETGGSRVRAIEDLRRLWTLIEQYDVPYVLTAGAQSHLDMRARRELAALGDIVGLSETDVERGLAEWADLSNRNEIRQEGSFVEPGVWRVNTDERE
jgi:ribonuclease P/MRP protein subunit RPP1